MKQSGPAQKYESCLLPCENCPYGGPKVGSRGNPKARVVFVGEAPGTQEMVHKTPLTGPSGEVFWRTLPLAVQLLEWGIDTSDDILILNACQCLPPRSKDAQKNMAAVTKGAAACQSRLLGQVMEHPRDLIVAMGNHALRSLTGNSGYKITQIRGQLLPSSMARIGLLPVLHPAALLRGTGNYRQFREDIAYCFDLLNGIPPKKPVVPRWLVLRNGFQVRQLAKALKSKPFIACDTETGGFNQLTDEVLAVGICADADLVYIIPERLVPLLKALFEEAEGRFIWHNGKFDMRFMKRELGEIARCDEDTMLLSYALDEQGGIHDLEQVGNDLIGAPDYKHMLKPYLPNKKTSYRVIPKPILYRYLALDTSNTRQVFDILRARVSADPNLEKLYTKVLMKASEFLYRVETQGIAVCPNRVENQSKRLQGEIDDAYARLQAVAKQAGYVGELNPNSPRQLAVVLFDLLKLKPKRPGNRSTAKAVLLELPAHPVIKGLQDYRKAKKAKSTYVDSLVRNVNIDGRVHATYLIHGTRSGRLSSRGPNMQNVPRGPAIRSMYMASTAHVFIKADLNQAELRSLAVLSGDEYLLGVYAPGSKRKLHHETAEEFFPGWTARGRDKNPEGLEQLMRAKAVNFGIVYGRTAPSIAEEFKISVGEAQKFIDKWAKRSPKAWEFIGKCRAAPLKGQNLVTVFGRKKRHWIVTQENLMGLQNEASNFPHQSIAHDICLLGGAKAAPILRPFGINPVNEVHDEVMFECPDIPEVIAWAKHVIVTCLESIAPEWGLTKIPFIAEADVGRRWSIYRNPREFRYEYQPSNPEEWYIPNEAVLRALASRDAHGDVLEGQLGVEKPAPTWSASELGSDDDEDDSDWTSDDGSTVWGFAPTTDRDDLWPEAT